MAATVPRRIGPYEVLSVLGEGGQGQVLRARHVELGAVRALKVIRDGSGERGGVRFAREAAALARVSHTNVVTVHEVGHDPEARVSWFAMDLVEGRPLSELLRAGPLPLERALDIAAQVARGVAALHAVGVVHRDLKPANVVLTPEGRAVVIDLGLAVAPERDHRLTATGQLVGTPFYMAPEQLHGKRACSPRTDVHALGLILYELVTGRVALDGPGGITSIAVRVLSADRPRPSEHDPTLPDALDDLVVRAAAIEPAQRPADAAAFADAVDALRSAPGPSSLRRRRGRLGLIAGALVALAALARVGLIAIQGSAGGAPVTAPPPAPASSPPAPAAPAPGPDAQPTVTALIREAERGPLRRLASFALRDGKDTPTGARIVGAHLVAWARRRATLEVRALDRPLDAAPAVIDLGSGTREVLERDAHEVFVLVEQDALLRVSLDGRALVARWPMIGAGRAVARIDRDRLLLAGEVRLALFDVASGRSATLPVPPDTAWEHPALIVTPAHVVLTGAERVFSSGTEELAGVLQVWRRRAVLDALEARDSLPPPDHVVRIATAVRSLRASPSDPELVAFTTANGEVGLLRAGSGEEPRFLVDERTADTATFRAANAHPWNQEVRSSLFLDGGRVLLTAARSETSRRGDLCTWDVATCAVLSRTAHDGTLTEGLEASGRLIIIGSPKDGVVELWAAPD